MAVGEPGNPQMYRLMTKPQEQLFPVYARPEEEHTAQDQARFVSTDGIGISRSTIETTAASQHSTRPSTPTSGAMLKDGSVSRRGSDTLVYHSLTIPRCISPSGGNLAELAAQVLLTFPGSKPMDTDELTGLDDVPFLVRISRSAETG